MKSLQNFMIVMKNDNAQRQFVYIIVAITIQKAFL